ncbi:MULTISPECIES: hypothetical protein [Paenarthrobacter]|uniref:hypothetical protein n=1 Tax=Paenarthrobacter TaxID=1742992 RepID=UPI00111ACE65|nr:MULTISPECIES: hypothetical protein [Paenarthrobacter]BCW13002.1 hypothetical protein NtRootA2_42840 [Arthrobacter sp. NtRootA2]BCW29583.1 hypothetical protein NtRootC45_41830 [Arthrobacter sp. NtRootC45]BCW33881.1 hypothetical protein NtRootD5_42120 [Arthrobacter sp. NtRootD5]MBP2396793.1 hypothetical protein [Paenarthrobacter nicotinovorans]GGV40800.1 hypothetical protein GCM10010212_32010 [Paenarthrobacter nicotinovorans]
MTSLGVAAAVQHQGNLLGEELWSEFETSGDLDLSEFADDSEYGVYFTHIYASSQQKRFGRQ